MIELILEALDLVLKLDDLTFALDELGLSVLQLVCLALNQLVEIVDPLKLFRDVVL